MSNQRLIYGFHAINARLWQHPKSVCEIWLMGGRQDARAKDVIHKAEQENIPFYLVDKDRLDNMSGHARHQGVVASIDASYQFTDLDELLEHLSEPPLLLVLDGVKDPHNLGACLRVAEAMGVHAVIAPKDRAAGLNATVSKVACGAAEIVPYVMVTNLARTLRDLKDHGVWIAGTDMLVDTTLYQFDARGPLAWVMGAEGEGMRRLVKEHCDVLVSIPMYGTVESLNVSVSAGIVLAETRRQRAILPAK